MRQYLDLLDKILTTGRQKGDRTGTGTISIFGHQMRFDLAAGFPLVTTKKIHLKSIIHELLWMISGSTNIKYLNDNGVRIWNEWALPDGELGPVYGKQWRDWGGRIAFSDHSFETRKPTHETRVRGIDQLAEAIRKVKEKPEDRRNLVCSWNVGEISQMRLPPCHCLYQFDVTDNRVSCQVYIRSWDVFIGAPFNLAFYALLTMMIAQVAGRQVGDLIVTSGDTHLYLNQIEQAKLQLTRDPYALPRMRINENVLSIDEFSYEDFTLSGYVCHPHIKAEVAV